MLDFTEFTLEDHKLATVLKMDSDFLYDMPYIFSSFFIGRMACAFGDFSFYWIVERDPLSVRVLKEKLSICTQYTVKTQK